MNYSLIAVPNFKKELKRLIKKYDSLKDEITVIFEQLEATPSLGTPIGKNCYKIRIAIGASSIAYHQYTTIGTIVIDKANSIKRSLQERRIGR